MSPLPSAQEARTASPRRRIALAVSVLLMCAVVAVTLWSASGDSPAASAGVEERVRRELTAPGPNQITPDGETVDTISCVEAERGWRCRARFPSGLELDCFMGTGEAPGPYCSTAQSRVEGVAAGLA